ncbi:MAG: glycerophosphodiester phosphodiesterase [Pseudomonadota bacterium]
MTVKVIAHRGASGYLPEHTKPAKVLAHVMGADYLEQDLVATRDDELLVLHDIYLDTVSDVAELFPGRQRDDGRYYVRDFDLDEVRRLTIFERMRPDGTVVYPDRYPAKTGHYRAHTFAEEIQLTNRLNRVTGRNTGIYPEIKKPAWHAEEGVDLTPLVLADIEAFELANDPDAVYVQCFDGEEVKRLSQAIDGRWRLVQLIAHNDWQESATDYDAMLTPEGIGALAGVVDGIGPWIPQLYTPVDGSTPPQSNGLVEAAHAAGLKVHPYTFRQEEIPPGFDDFADLVRFFVSELKVDGVFTDFPDSVIELLKAQ